MVSTLTPAALAKAPMVRFSKMACIPVDSVHKYGGKVTPAAPETKGQVHVGTQKRAWRPLRRRAGCHSCLHVLPRASSSGRPGVQRRLDRKFDSIGALPPHLHRRGAGGDVFRLAAHFPAGTSLQAK